MSANQGWCGRPTPRTELTPRLCLALLLVLTLAGGYIRGSDLPNLSITMGRDASRLALAAQGMLQQGAPRLPGGLVYTRGLLPAGLEAVSFALLGKSDVVARLPSLIAGTLLIPAVYLLARGMSGPITALAAAAIVALTAQLVAESRVAWMYAHLALWLVLALALLQRGGQTGSVVDRALAGGAAAAALFSHELAILLVPIVGLYDLLTFGPLFSPRWRVIGRRGNRPAGERPVAERARRALAWRQLGVFWPTVLLASAGLAGLSLALRSSSLGGATSEIREYIQPGFGDNGLIAVLQGLPEQNPWLFPVALLGLPLRRPLRSRARLLYLALLVMILFNSFVLVGGNRERYIVMILPLLAVAAAYSTARVATALSRRLLRGERFARARLVVGASALLALTVVSFDPNGLHRELAAGYVSSNPIQLMADLRPDDLILSYSGTITTYYFGRTDFWLRPTGYAKYVWAGQQPLRDVHSGGIVIRNREELERFVVAPNSGRRLWVLLDPSTSNGPEVRDILAALVELGAETRRAGDDRIVLRLQL